MQYEDTRPMLPEDWAMHLKNECVEVYTQDTQQALSMVPDNLQVKLKKSERDGTFSVVDMNNARLGLLYDSAAERAGLMLNGTYIAEIVRPCWRFKNAHELYIPFTLEALEKKRQLKEMALWINLDQSKWLGDAVERMNYYDARIIVNNANDGKPIYGVISDNRMLFQVSPKMKCYGDVSRRADIPIRRLIVELHVGEYGYYYRIGFYY